MHRYNKARLSFSVSICLWWGVANAVAQTAPSPKPAAVDSQTPVFDVSTIKPNNSTDGMVRVSWGLATFAATNVTLEMLMEDAYNIRHELIAGLPGWADTAHFDIVAKAVDTDTVTLKNLTREQREQMLVQLLADRFQLKLHTQVKELPVFDLVIAKDGIKFKEFQQGDPDAKPGSMSMNNTEMTAHGVPLETLTSMLERQVERNVIDKTGLTGKYDLHLKWHRDEDGTSAGLGDEALPTLFTALQEQLGLKLQPSKGPVDTIVVDHVAAPSEN